MRIDHYIHFDEAQLSRINWKLDQLLRRSEIMAKELDELEAEVARNTSVDESAIVLLNGLAAKIEAMKNDPVKLAALAAELRAKNDALAAAVTANTPSEEEPPA